MTLTMVPEAGSRTDVECFAPSRRRARRAEIVRESSGAPSPGDAALQERDFVARLRQGDDAAYATLVRTHGPSMLSVARGYLPTREDAEDVLQSAFLLAFRFIDRFEGASKLSTWLHRIVVNSALMRLRRHKRHPETCLNALGLGEDGVAELLGRVGPSAAEELARRETHERLLRAVGRLPDPVRAAVRLRVVDGRTLAETSLLLGQSPAVVKRSIERGRVSLRTMLARNGESPVRDALAR